MLTMGAHDFNVIRLIYILVKIHTYYIKLTINVYNN